MHFVFKRKTDFDHDFVHGNIRRLETYLDDCWEQKQEFIEKVNRFLYLINGEAKNDVETFLSQVHTLDEYKDYVIKFHVISSTIPIDIKPKVTIGILEFNFTGIINILCKQANTFKDVIIVNMNSVYLALGKK